MMLLFLLLPAFFHEGGGFPPNLPRSADLARHPSPLRSSRHLPPRFRLPRRSSTRRSGMSEQMARKQEALNATAEREAEQQLWDREKLTEKIKEAGVAGVISYGATEVAFWLTSLPLAIAAFLATFGAIPDMANGEDAAKVAVYSAGFLSIARALVPLRIAAALALTPLVGKYIKAAQTEKGADDSRAVAADDIRSQPLHSSALLSSSVATDIATASLPDRVAEPVVNHASEEQSGPRQQTAEGGSATRMEGRACPWLPSARARTHSVTFPLPEGGDIYTYDAVVLGGDMANERKRPPVVVIPPVGVGISMEVWKRMAKHYLSQGWDAEAPMHLIDLLGTGTCEPKTGPSAGGEPFTTALYAAQLQHYIETHVREPVVLVAQGASATVAMALLERSPQLLRGLILTSSPGRRRALRSLQSGPGVFSRLAWRASETRAGRAFYRWASRPSFIRYFSEAVLLSDETQTRDGSEWMDTLTKDTQKNDISAAVLSFLTGHIMGDYRDAMRKASIPVLLVMGKAPSIKDQRSRKGRAEDDRAARNDRLVDTFRGFFASTGVECITLSGCSPFWESGWQVAQEIHDFMTRHFDTGGAAPNSVPSRELTECFTGTHSSEG
ncbi:unnamed protein product [Vitrella brassicaformis CCMP3155]|uniref:AB hydrolase-1 domain-containing protein n=2 Tax=Vitrella brassicaformis TaxID=1169539 RepID=A0A0G4GD47_VITBC|nr:unnamed protein product [Vitrella brassicaformis CCMP3155]|mmetsp:Transcript_4455/g.11742  ORF Transcript_4455/g.11742 Transcript_4455/m.11742 type:complete len:613 (-) Transcript_4455:497-2335(-)|eukprot:CEM26925.1 unnamed protein product [Vitrella brassicaformis CCMP3155]